MPAASLPTSPQARIDGRWLLIFSALAAALAVLAMVVSSGLPLLDTELRTQLMRLQATPLWPALDLVNLVGYPAAWDTATVATAAYLAVRWGSALPLAMPMWLFIGETAAVLAKLAVDRARPPGVVIQDLVTAANVAASRRGRHTSTTGV